MKTVEEIISDIRELPKEKRTMVSEFLFDLDFQETCYSDEDMDKIEKDFINAQNEIDVSPVLKTPEETLNYLKKHRKS